jgi:hypothetical protein
MSTGPESAPHGHGGEGFAGSLLGGLAKDPAKVVRVGTSLIRLLDEVRTGPLNDDARVRLAHVHQRSVEELRDGLAPGPAAELQRLWQPLTSGSSVSQEELRIGQAQLSGWIDGLVQDIQSSLEARQAATQQMLAPLQLPLPDPPGSLPAVLLDGGTPGQSASGEPNPGDDVELPGQYL